MDSLLNRINELAKLKKERDLTQEEKNEQETLRKKYIENFRNNFLEQLKNIKVIDENGQDVTPEKLKQDFKKQLEGKKEDER